MNWTRVNYFNVPSIEGFYSLEPGVIFSMYDPFDNGVYMKTDSINVLTDCYIDLRTGKIFQAKENFNVIKKGVFV